MPSFIIYVFVFPMQWAYLIRLDVEDAYLGNVGEIKCFKCHYDKEIL